MAQGVSLLGKSVRAQGNSFTVTSGTASTSTVILGQDAKSVKVSISNSGGQVVRTLDLGSLASGERQISWDGKDSQGKQVADGTYSFQVAATDAKGKAVDAATYFTGEVEEVLQNQGTVYVKVNGRLISLDNVFAVDQSS
jgi:flagellar basal-body rod modification protein FlgD